METDEKAQKQNVGNAGEYYIASRLSALDFTATLTLGRAEKYDILALGPKGKLVKISVKTTQLDYPRDFPLSEKDESGYSDDFYYAFVKLNKFEKEPDFWIIPSTVVSPMLKNSYELWLKTPGKNNRERKGSSIRSFPIKVLQSQTHFPLSWNDELVKYYKNLKQLI
jgi:hypothetical protein